MKNSLSSEYSDKTSPLLNLHCFLLSLEVFDSQVHGIYENFRAKAGGIRYKPLV